MLVMFYDNGIRQKFKISVTCYDALFIRESFVTGFPDIFSNKLIKSK